MDNKYAPAGIFLIVKCPCSLDLAKLTKAESLAWTIDTVAEDKVRFMRLSIMVPSTVKFWAFAITLNRAKMLTKSVLNMLFLFIL